MQLYVGNLAYGVTEGDLQTAFSAYGTVSSAELIKDKFTGQSKGFAFVEVDGDINRITSQLNGTMLGGRAIKVSEAQERQQRGGGGGGSRGGHGGSRGSGGRGGGYGRDRGGNW